jgi:D-alanyl-D-alanine carboxypeptidase
LGKVGSAPATPAAERTVIGVLLAQVIAVAAVVSLEAAGLLTFFYEQVTGRPVAIVEEIVGPETGPVCPRGERYVDEEPKGLRPHVLEAWHRLRAEAEEHGVQLCLNDGKRSYGQQQREFTEAVRRFGVPELAAKYVLPPEKSMHVTGIAVDVQPVASAGWVERNGQALGWCRRYENEYWHFEYDPAYAVAGCPVMLPSALES